MSTPPSALDPRQKGEVHHGLAGSTRQDQGAIARFVASQGRGLHHVAVKSPDIDALLGFMAAAGLPMIDTGAAPARAARSSGPVQRIDHVGVASTDVREDEATFCGRLGFAVESRQTDMEVSMAVESFTSDTYGVVYHARPPQPIGGLRVTFVTVGDCELEFRAEVALAQPVFIYVAGEDYGVENLIRHPPTSG